MGKIKSKHIAQWIGYKLFCYRTGKIESNINTLKEFIELYY